MRLAVPTVAAVLLLAAAAPLPPVPSPASQPDLPPGHPPMPTAPGLPPGHPAMPGTPDVPPGHPALVPSNVPDVAAPVAPAARPEDVATIEAIVGAWYDVISGPKGEARAWSRFHSLLLPGALLVTTRAAGAGAVPMVLSGAQYEQSNRVYFENGGYFEREAHRRVERFGRVAQVFSTYESRRRATDDEPYSRGINAFQLLHDGQRWWIVSVTWDHERPGEGVVLPPELQPADFLPPIGADGG